MRKLKASLLISCLVFGSIAFQNCAPSSDSDNISSDLPPQNLEAAKTLMSGSFSAMSDGKFIGLLTIKNGEISYTAVNSCFHALSTTNGRQIPTEYTEGLSGTCESGIKGFCIWSTKNAELIKTPTKFEIRLPSIELRAMRDFLKIPVWMKIANCPQPYGQQLEIVFLSSKCFKINFLDDSENITFCKNMDWPTPQPTPDSISL